MRSHLDWQIAYTQDIQLSDAGASNELPPDSSCKDLNGGYNPQASSKLSTQLQSGYWGIAPSFLSLIFSLVKFRRAFRLVFHTRRPLASRALQGFLSEFNMLCEGKHPAFNGENRTKQVFG